MSIKASLGWDFSLLTNRNTEWRPGFQRWLDKSLGSPGSSYYYIFVMLGESCDTLFIPGHWFFAKCDNCRKLILQKWIRRIQTIHWFCRQEKEDDSTVEGVENHWLLNHHGCYHCGGNVHDVKNRINTVTYSNIKLKSVTGLSPLKSRRHLAHVVTSRVDVPWRCRSKSLSACCSSNKLLLQT